MDEYKICKGGCKRELSKKDFGINKKTNEEYKHCISCRINRTKDKSTYEEDRIKEEDMEEKKLKRENRPNISLQKQQIILKEQNYKCRGPGKHDNKEYECDMNVNNKRFSDKKASEPQFDHIKRWKEGGNGLKNIQALCSSCHLMKTSMENIINEDSQCPSERVVIVLNSLSKPKYEPLNESSSDSEDEFII